MGGPSDRIVLRFALAFTLVLVHHTALIKYVRDVYAAARRTRRPALSFEFFPTKSEEAERTLLHTTIPALGELRPDFCSVTYGAGGSTREKTLAIVDRIQREQQITTMAHLTCVNATVAETHAVLERTRALGIKNILALRGDPPAGTGAFVRTEGGFEYSYQLVESIRALGGFSIGVAGFPEGHVACTEGKHQDWRRLKMKIDHGADFVITQLFFDNCYYLECRDFLAAQGVIVPLVPGILPILNTSQLQRFVALCGATVPKRLLTELEKRSGDDEAVVQFGIEYATRQCEELLREGAPGLHFYTLNRTRSTTEVVKNLGLQRSISKRAPRRLDTFIDPLAPARPGGVDLPTVPPPTGDRVPHRTDRRRVY
jgi:methylenetetrahydrofolate reductase (NADPH)